MTEKCGTHSDIHVLSLNNRSSFVQHLNLQIWKKRWNDVKVETFLPQALPVWERIKSLSWQQRWEHWGEEWTMCRGKRRAWGELRVNSRIVSGVWRVNEMQQWNKAVKLLVSNNPLLYKLFLIMECIFCEQRLKWVSAQVNGTRGPWERGYGNRGISIYAMSESNRTRLDARHTFRRFLCLLWPNITWNLLNETLSKNQIERVGIVATSFYWIL